ncbi:MAG: NAD(P)H-dependent oxidoreductase subunit E [bacterium]|nr:NAD(P)H-dependent oxidoreductase subunit E [bacterium]
MSETTTGFDTGGIDTILARYDGFEGHLIGILHEVQKLYNYLPREALERVSEQTGFTLERLYSIATFYNFFSLEPRGKHVIRVCTGTACHVKGAPRVLQEIEERLEISSDETTPDGQFSIEHVHCVGTCSLAPVVVVDQDTHSHVKPSKVRALLKNYEDKG